MKRIQKSAEELLPSLLVRILPYPVSGMCSLTLLHRLIKGRLKEELDIDVLNKSLPGNVTSEMGLIIGDLADLARQNPEVADYLKGAKDSTFSEKRNIHAFNSSLLQE